MTTILKENKTVVLRADLINDVFPFRFQLMEKEHSSFSSPGTLLAEPETA